MRSTLHIRTTGFYCKACPKVVENALRTEPGVVHVMAVHSMSLTSVMYDPEVTDADALCTRIRSAGFDAAPYCPGDNETCPESDTTEHGKGTGEGHEG